jgi:hypothetical protein
VLFAQRSTPHDRKVAAATRQATCGRAAMPNVRCRRGATSQFERLCPLPPCLNQRGANASYAPRSRIDLFAGTEFQIQRRGEHPWFAGTCLRVPAGTLRDRAIDVATPQQLAASHAVYRERVVQGPSYRADMWAALKLNPSLTPTELARRT